MDKLPWTMRAPRKSMPEFYIDEVLPILMRRRVSNLPNLCNGLETYVAYCFYSNIVHTCFFFLVYCLPVFVVIYHVQGKHVSYIILVINLFHFRCCVWLQYFGWVGVKTNISLYTIVYLLHGSVLALWVLTRAYIIISFWRHLLCVFIINKNLRCQVTVDRWKVDVDILPYWLNSLNLCRLCN